MQLVSGRVFLRACECGLKKSFEPKAEAKRSQRLRAGHRRSKSEGQKENLNRLCQARPQAVPIGTEPKATQVFPGRCSPKGRGIAEASERA